MRGIICLLLAAFLFLPGGTVAWPAEGGGKGKTGKSSGRSDLFSDDNEPIVITSDRMELDRKKSTITYRGNVLTVRGDLEMRSDTLSGVIDFEGQGLKTIVAAGNVRVFQEGRTATGEKAIFDSEKETITLVGNPVIQQGNSKVSGDRVIVYLKEDRGVVEGGTQRVKAVIFPGELGNTDKGKGGKGSSRKTTN